MNQEAIMKRKMIRAIILQIITFIALLVFKCYILEGQIIVCNIITLKLNSDAL